MNRPRLLDLFCGAGGAAMGYHRAGFDEVIVREKRGPRPNPEPPTNLSISRLIWKDEALEILRAHEIRGISKYDRDRVHNILAATLPQESIRSLAVQTMRARITAGTWREK